MGLCSRPKSTQTYVVASAWFSRNSPPLRPTKICLVPLPWVALGRMYNGFQSALSPCGNAPKTMRGIYFTVLGMFFSFVVFWLCSIFTGGLQKTKFFATIPRVDMFN